MARKIDPAKREKILLAAREAFREQGIEKATIPLIAKNAGIATGTVYLYFKSKNEIIEALVDLYYERNVKRVIRNLSQPDMATAIKKTVHEALLHAKKEKDLLRLIDIYRGSGKMKPTKGDETGTEIVRASLEKSMDQGIAHVYNPRIVAEITGGMIEWIAKLCFIYNVADISRYEETLVLMLQHAFIKDFPSQQQEGYSSIKKGSKK